MAIAEAEPKKSEVPVMSTGARQNVKTLDSLNTLPKRKEGASSSTQKSVKTYDLYRSVKDFSFYMPDGWNDQDIGIFVEGCWENLENFKKINNGFDAMWQGVVDFGTKMSLNPTLFTINSCLEVAQCIKEYVTRNKKTTNDLLRTFFDDVVNLLQYFPPYGSNKNIPNDKLAYLMTFREEENCVKMLDTLNEYLPQFKDRTASLWDDLAKAVEDRTGYCFEVRDFLEFLKSQVIKDVEQEDDPSKKLEIINRCEPYLKPVFDYVDPLSVKMSDFMLSINSTVKLKDNSNEPDSTRSGSVENSPRLSNTSEMSIDDTTSSSDMSVLIGNESEEVEQEGNNLAPVKRKKGRPRKSDIKFLKSHVKPTGKIMEVRSTSLEPTSTTTHEEGVNSTVSSSNYHNLQPNAKSVAQSPATKRLKKERPTPTRILPSREARPKVSSFNSPKSKKPVSRKSSSNIPRAPHDSSDSEREAAKKSPDFKGFEDFDCGNASEEEESGNMNYVREVTTSTTRRTYTRRLPNPDTTTNDLDCETVSVNCAPNGTDDDIYVRRLTRQTKESLLKGNFITEEKVENKVTTVNYVHADSTLNPVVKLHALKESDLQRGLIRNISSTSCLSNVDRKRLKLSIPSSKPNIPVESAVVGKDVIESVYNPNTDSAKTHAGPGSPTTSRSTGSRPCPNPLNIVMPPEGQRQHCHYFSDDTDDDELEPLEERESNILRKCLPTGDKHSQIRAPVREPFLNNEPSGSSQGTSRSNAVVGNDAYLPSNQPSTSASAPLPNEMELAVLQRYLDMNNKQVGQVGLPPAFEELGLYHAKPRWFDDFVIELRKQQVWKMQQFVKMQQDLVHLENERLSIVKDIRKQLVEERKKH